MKRNEDRNAKDVLRRQADRWGIELDSIQLSLLERYAQLLAGYALANVIGTRDYAAIMLEHIADALSCAITGLPAGNQKTIDVGAGGGLPGIPLRIAYQDLRLTLLEATRKKTRFLETVVGELELPGIEIVNRRAEDVAANVEYRHSFDVAMARAVAELPVVIEYCAPLIRPGGAIIAMKGSPSSQEIDAGKRAAAEVGAELETVRAVTFIPEMVQKERNLVVFRKTATTPRGYPRRVGLAKQKPLGGQGER